MNFIIFLIIVLSLVSCSKKKEYMGKEPTYYGSSLTVSELLNRNLKQTHVRIRGKVVNICKTEGCWFILQSNESTIRCVFEEPSLFMDIQNMGKEMSFEGQLKDEIVDEETAKSYASQEGKAVNSILGKQRISVFVISTILLEE